MIYRLLLFTVFFSLFCFKGISNRCNENGYAGVHTEQCPTDFSKDLSPIRDTVYLNNWVFFNRKDSVLNQATVPGTVQSDLIKSGKIENPATGNNEPRIQNIGRQYWVYRTIINLDKVKFKEPLLVFEGIDTHADILIDGIKVAESHNMFVKKEVSIPLAFRDGNHTLEVRFFPAERYDSLSFLKDKIGRIPDKRTFSRKAGYHYGWDWGPKVVTVGLWKPVYLIENSMPRISSLRLRTLFADKNGNSVLECNSRIQGSKKGVFDFQLVIGELNIDTTFSFNYAGEDVLIKFPIKVSGGRLWWPNGMGDQILYSSEARIKENGLIRFRLSRDFGIRTITLNRQNDSIGSSFEFSCNGAPFFARGANYIPGEIFLPLTDLQKQKQMLIMCRQSGFNMIRVWGGGVYESDRFYQLCDSLGLVVWQDFMFACYFYPASQDFLDNVKAEAIQQIERISQFTSLGLWCGNNEVDEAWKNWGYQKALEYSANDSIEQAKRHYALFDELLPQMVKSYDQHTPYVSSSPLHGWGRKESLTAGDQHYWGVWWGEQPFEIFRDKTGRFASEYGFQAYPDVRTINDWCQGVWPLSDSDQLLAAHQKHSRGREIISNTIKQYYKEPESFDQMVYLSQIIQKDALTVAIESHRLSSPKCSGTLFWQLNDCWPVTSWSVLDYYLRPKAAWYSLKRLFAPIMVGEGGSTQTPIPMLVSDYDLDSCFVSITGYSQASQVTVFDRLANVREREPIVLTAVSDLGKFLNKMGTTPDFLIIQIDSAYLAKDKGSAVQDYRSDAVFPISKVTSRNGQPLYKIEPRLTVKEKVICNLSPTEKGNHDAKIFCSIAGSGSTYTIELWSETMIPDLILSLDNRTIDYSCSDNQILLNGRRTIQIKLEIEIGKEELRNNLLFRSWYINNGKPVPIVWRE